MDEDLRELFGALTADEVAALDRAAEGCGVGTPALMEIAGWQVARCAWLLLGKRAGRIGIVAGRGNNGGDGALAARHLASWGCDVRLHVLAEPDALRPHLLACLEGARAGGAEVTVGAGADEALARAGGADLAVDALLGTGSRSAPRPPASAAVAGLSRMRTLAVDIPSGLDATTGEVHEPCVTAAATVTLAAVKRGMWDAPGRAMCGDVYGAAIGLPAAAWRTCGLVAPAALRGGGLVPVPSLGPQGPDTR